MPRAERRNDGARPRPASVQSWAPKTTAAVDWGSRSRRVPGGPGAVPAPAMSASPDGLDDALGGLGIDALDSGFDTARLALLLDRQGHPTAGPEPSRDALRNGQGRARG